MDKQGREVVLLPPMRLHHGREPQSKKMGVVEIVPE
jgi:hypothetical protein